MKLVAIRSGSDWTDARCEHVLVPNDIDFGAVERGWQTWYDNEYLPALHAGNQPRYISFEVMLVERYGATSAPVEEYDR